MTDQNKLKAVNALMQLVEVLEELLKDVLDNQKEGKQ